MSQPQEVDPSGCPRCPDNCICGELYYPCSADNCYDPCQPGEDCPCPCHIPKAPKEVQP